MPHSFSPAQCRAARGLLDWTQEHLADVAGVSRSTVRDFEKGRHDLSRASAAQIMLALEQAGVFLIPADSMGPGVRLAQRPDHPQGS
jgi:transcriptional regulator with XRE-family HTH domain